MLKSASFAFALSLLLLTHDAAAVGAPHLSFSRGFSSHAASVHLSPSAPKSSFGAFSRRATAAPSAPAPAPARAPSGSFGSFGGAAAQTQKSDSALSQQLGKNASQAKALQTLDERNAAKAAQNAPQPAPGYAQQSVPVQPGGAPAPAAPTTVVVHQGGSGLGNVLAGAMIAHSMNAHARAGYYPAPNYNGQAAPAQNSGGGSFFHLFITLCLLAVIAWGIWFAWRGLQRRRAARRDANKPNYSFERN